MSLVIFDLDNTLIDRAASFERWAARFVADRRLSTTEVRWLLDADGDGFVPRLAFMAAVRQRYGLRDSVETLLGEYQAEIVSLVDLDLRVPELLDQLRESGWRVVIATNGSTAQQSAKIRRTGLADHVDAVAISEEVGAAKPDRFLFEVAAKRCGAHLADGGWMIGDCAVRDVGGGQQAGLRTMWIRRGRVWDSAAPQPDVTLDAVTEAAAVLIPGVTGRVS